MPHAELLQRAKELLRGGQLDAAEALCRQLQSRQLQGRQLLDQAPREPALWQMLGYIELERGRLPEAEAHLRQAAGSRRSMFPAAQTNCSIVRQR